MNPETDPNRRDFLKRSAALAATASIAPRPAGAASAPGTGRIMNHNPEMEYRRCGKTGWMISAICLGGHWKRIDLMVPGVLATKSWLSAKLGDPGFQRNRRDIVTRCIERGINYIDACTFEEVQAYSKALEGRRDQMHLGWSYYQKEARRPECRTADALVAALDESLRVCGQQYVDLWRITCIAESRKGPDGVTLPAHDERESEQIAKALERAKRAGKARAIGVSSHDRAWLEYMMKTFPEQIEVVVSPYTAKTKALPQESFFDTIRKADCGFFGIKPFSANAMFKGNSTPASPDADADSRVARLTLRYILANPVITAPIPGLVTVEQVDNAARAVRERRELDEHEKAELDAAAERAWASLPPHYQWLKEWEYV